MHVEAEVALKEWAVVCAALRDGRQGLLLRKGGVREANPGREFAVEHRAFALLPTHFHAQDAGRARDLIPAVHAELAELRPPPAGLLHIDLHAEVTGVWHLGELAPLLALAGRHVLSEAAVVDRFNYRRPGLWVLQLRVRRLARTIELSDRPGYAGCASWVHLDAAIGDEAEPALTDEQHARLTGELRETLGEESP
jgi:hypothetical protein